MERVEKKIRARPNNSKKNSCKAKNSKKIFVQGRKKIHTPRGDRKKFVQDENSPHPHHFSNGRTLTYQSQLINLIKKGSAFPVGFKEIAIWEMDCAVHLDTA